MASKTMAVLSLEFGALAEPPTQQLERQGFSLPNGAFLDMDAAAIARLYVRGLMTEAETTKAWKRLRSSIARLARPAATPE
jgi:hypothetical protein